MATVKVKWRPSTIEGKAGTIYYRIIHNRVSRQLKTEYKLFAEEWDEIREIPATANIERERVGRISAIRERIDGDIKQIRLIIDIFDNRGDRYTADDIAGAFVTRSRGHSFFNFMQDVVVKLRILDKHRTAENYITASSSFMKFRENRDLLLGELDSELMMRYESYLTARGITKNTVSFYMRILRAVYNRAVEQGLTEQRKPFRHVYTGIDKTVKRAISFTAVKRIKGLDLSSQPVLDFARDMFLFSFCTRGMSFVDMAYLKKTDLRNGSVVYRRRKTGQQLAIRWEPCMQEIVEKYRNRNGYRRMPDRTPYLLPILKPFDNDCNRYRSSLQQVNKSLKRIAQLAGLDGPLTMYVARHSWASITKSKNIPISVISEGMGHDSEITTQIYLASLDTAVIDRANSLILKGL